MSVDLSLSPSSTSSASTSSAGERTVAGFGRRIAERRRLSRQERANEQLAELHSVRSLVADAAEVVTAGWVQRAWFAYRDQEGLEHLVGARNLRQITGRQLTGACLVGAVVHAAGGLSAARTSRVHHALNLTWQAWSGLGSEPIGFCPDPATRAARVCDLTAWNDHPHRRAEDVTALLDSAGRVAAGQIGALRRETALTAPD